MKKHVLAILAAGVSLFQAPSLSADEALPSVQAVMDHFIAATGGRAAWEARHNLVEHATIDLPKQGVKGTQIVYQASPNKYLALIDLTGIGKLSSGSNGEVAWENNVLQGPRVKNGVEKADAFREGAFNADLRWQELYVKAETTGVETVAGHECYKVVLTPKEGKPLTEYFDKTSGLKLKTATIVSSQMGDIAAEILYDDYRKDGGILTAHRAVNHAAQQEFVVQVQSIEANAELAKDRFDLPPEIQALVNKPAQAEAKPESPVATARSAESPDRGKLTIFMAGNPVASETYTLSKSSEGGIDIDGSGSANLGPMKIEIEKFEVRTNEKFEPVEAIAKGKLGAIQMNVHTTFAGGQAKNEIDTGQGPQNKDIPVHSGALVVNANLPLYPWTLLAMRASFDPQQNQEFPVYVIGQAEVTATVLFKGREQVEFAGRSADLNHLAVSGKTPQGQAINMDFWIDNNRKIIKLAVPAQGVEAYQDGYEPKASSSGAGQPAPKG
jgi:hypothetical protein